MFVYEDETKQSLVLFAGIPDEWLVDESGVGFDKLPTAHGVVSASIKPIAADHLIVRVEGNARPAGGFELRSPLSRPIRSAMLNGKAVEVKDGGSILIPAAPAEIDIRY